MCTMQTGDWIQQFKFVNGINELQALQGGNSQNFFVIIFCNFKILLRSSYS